MGVTCPKAFFSAISCAAAQSVSVSFNGDLQMGQLLKITAACCFGYTIPTQNQGPAFEAAAGQAFIFISITTYEVLGEAECPPGAEAAPQLSKATLDRTTTTSTPGDHPTCMLATTAVACA